MPFGFLKRRDAPAASVEETPTSDSRTPREVAFEGLTDEWRVRGRMILVGRLLDAINKREPIAVTGMEWAPADGSADWSPAPGIKSMDPYDLILVLATPETLAPMTDEERRAHKVHKVSFDVSVEAPPYRVLGTVLLNPGTDPDGLLDRGTQMFYAFTRPDLFLGDLGLGIDGTVQAILVNRFYIRGIDQIDRGTGERILALPSLRGGKTPFPRGPQEPRQPRD